ncbi:MAG: RES family NAD+ phosphorylase [Calditrichaeota bacterium]|nr:RES family NAD+ phosphorylase [Calditrichota bacterium]
MHLYRICSSRYATDLSGSGAALYGGRWNKKGQFVLYCGESKEIALLETIVHVPPQIAPDLSLITLEIPDQSCLEMGIEQLPANWRNYPAPIVLAELGAEWYRDGQYLALKVPSCIIDTAWNYILNCSHPDFTQVQIISTELFPYDQRLQRK